MCCEHDLSNEIAGRLKILAVGPWMIDDVDLDAWLEQANEESKELFVRIANIASSHPIMVKRIRALIDRKERGYGSHGEMI